MTPHQDPRQSQERLEQFVHRALQELPPRRAPGSLEERVLAELARRSALPWWRQNFAHWPTPALAAFILASLGVVKLMTVGAAWAVAGFDVTPLQVALAEPLAWWESARAVFTAVGNACEVMVRSIPPLWLYGGLAVIAAVYATLFGLGAAAFKALRAQH